MLYSSDFFQQCYKLVDDALIQYIDKMDAPSPLKESIAYSVKAGGKRIRPLLLLATLHAFKKDLALGIPAACAVEFVHTYSLIHDDLPSMDNDDFRRGKPTNHKVFGEAMAILAGDGLLTYSFQILTEKTPPLTNDKRVRLIYELAKAAGPMGMVAGQALDITGESRSLTIKELEHVHANKTGKLLAFSVKAGAILGDAEPAIIEKLEEFAFHLGLAFQIRDDILDVEGSSEIMGKSAGIDANNKKTTYPSLLSVSVAKEKLSEHIKKAKEILHSLPLDTNHLEFLTDLVEKRDR